MEAVFEFKIDALNETLIEKIKSMFSPDAKCRISITEEAISETDYLLSTENNRTTLRQSISELRNNKLIVKNISELL